jgi:hypothetical protein
MTGRGQATAGGVFTRWTYRRRANGTYAAALWQGSRLVFMCEHSHGWQAGAKDCAKGTAGSWPGAHRVLNGPNRVPTFRLPWLPDVREGGPGA